MPVSGLVVTLTDDLCLRQQAVEAIGREPRLEIGFHETRRMAVVMDTVSSDEDKSLWHWLHSLPGVVFVDVTLVGFEDETDRPPSGLPPSFDSQPLVKDKLPDGR